MELTTIQTETAQEGLRTAAATVVATDDSVAAAAARFALGIVMLPHGLQKLTGAFGGYGFDATMGYLTDGVGLPWLIALAVILIESVGALALLTGTGARLAAAGVAAVMFGAVATSHLQYGFFMNWSGTSAGEGFEYHILALGLAAVVVVSGAGRWSVDRKATAAIDSNRR